jgi:5-methyltetrahydrofolate--homocysteine methyltransferase
MGTQLQTYKVPDECWLDENGANQEGCNELLNATATNEVVAKIHNAYALADADMIKTNTFGAMPWVLDEYDMGHRAYELSKLGCQIVKDICDRYSTDEKPRFVLGSIGPGTKLPSLGHITYDEMYDGYCVTANGMVDGGVDIFLLETCQDPLQIKAALHALSDTAPNIPIMVSATIELSGTMLIGTDATTLATILEPFDILSLGFNCGTGPEQVKKHLKALSEVWHKPISIHSNAGLPQNRGGYTYYPMGPSEFTAIQSEFLDIDGVAFLGGCCGTTPQHIKALSDGVSDKTPKLPSGSHPKALSSLFSTVPLKQEIPPLLIGERSNATGSKAFRELLKAEDYEGTLSVAQQQVRAGAHVIDVSVGFAGRDETTDMNEVVSRYREKIQLPLMPDSTQIKALETALKLIGGKAIINSVNLEDGEEKFDEICQLAKRYGASLVCLVIDEVAMAKTTAKKVEIATRIYDRAVNIHGLAPEDLVFDMLVFTVGSGDDEYRTAGVETIEAIREFTTSHPKVGTTLGLSNISFGLDKNARIYLNSMFLHHCVEAGLSSAIVNVAHILPMNKINDEDKRICNNLLLNNWEDEKDPLFEFINHFSSKEAVDTTKDDGFDKLSDEEKVKKLLLDGDKERLLPLAMEIKERVAPEIIVNEWLIDGMKVIGELFGNGQMQLPFVLQSAETMKATVDTLNPFLPKQEKSTDTTIILGTVKGDVHDVGKNLVDIILSNNGFKVINIGIKADIEQFVEILEQNPNIDAIGFSGLLVKSTAIMKENFEYLKEKGIKVPVLIGGAALNKSFVDEYCRPNYDGDIFYCRDAFDGVLSMQRIEAGGELDTNMPADLVVSNDEQKEEKTEFNPDIHTPELFENHDIFIPPFWGRREMSFSHNLAFEWINHRILFRQRWGYRKKGLSTEEFETQEKEVVEPIYERLKNQFIDDGIFEPIALYGYYPCIARDNTLLILSESYIYNSKDEIKNSNEIKKEDIIARFEFPRQSKPPHRALSDYFSSSRVDVIGLSFASSGLKITDFEKTIYDRGEYSEYYLVHGLGVELAEAVAEIVHKQIRLDLNITENEGSSLKDVQMKQYQGARYSPGYGSCPDLAQNKGIFDMINPYEFGIDLSESFQIDPEQSTVAFVIPNKEAKYYNI